MREEENMEEVKMGCLGWLMYAVGSGLSVDYILSWFSKDIPFIADMIIGIFVSAISIPVAKLLLTRYKYGNIISI